MVCRDVLCHQGRILENGACLHSFNRATNITCFSTSIRLTPLSNSKHIEESPYLVSLIRQNLETNLSICAGMETGVLFFVNANDLHHVQYFVAFIAVFIPAHDRDCVDFFDTLIALTPYNITLIDIFSNIAINLSLEAAVYNISFTRRYVAIAVPNMFDSTVTVLEKGASNVLENICDKNKLTEINKLFVCPFIMLDVDEISIVVKNDYLFLSDVDLPDKRLKTFSKWEYEKHGNDTFICLDDFIELYNVMLESKSRLSKQVLFHERDNVKHSLTLACVSLSIVSLLVTIVVYISHPSLHSQPGINNIIFCTFLLMAQTLYQFGAGQTSLPNYACALIGAMCHFSGYL